MTYSEEQIEKYRGANVDYEWWEDIYDHWKRTLTRFGIAVGGISFSGFCSQGDGASFTGWVENDQRFITFMTGGTKAYPLWRKLAERRELSIKITRSDRHYVHECSTSVEVEAGEFCYGDDTETDPVLYYAHRAWDDKINAELREFENDARDFVRALNHYIYKDLEREYECLTSDEAVIEWMEANDIMPDAED